MPTPPSPARIRILQLLADGDWHPVDQVLAAAALTVPPGQAWRTAERIRLSKVTNPDRSRGDDDTAITAGRNHVARHALHSLIGKHGNRPALVERDGTRIRLTKLGAATIGAPRPKEQTT